MKSRLWRALAAMALLSALGNDLRAAGPLPSTQARPEDAGFASVLAPRAFQFPRDHGPHPEYRQEWWYFTGQLRATDGERFGFELTFFRFALAPPEANPASQEDSDWRTRQLFMAHFAITDLGRKQFHFAEKLARGAVGLAGAEFPPLRVWVDDWALREVGVDRWELRASEPTRKGSYVGALSPQFRAKGGRQVQATQLSLPGYQLRLDLRALMAPVLNGQQGLSRKSDEPGSASYYYSIPRVAAHGELIRDGQILQVDGVAWLDREWGSGALGQNEVGWDWFGLQFTDGSALMLYSLRNRDGSRDPHSAGTWVDAAGQARALNSADLQIEVLNEWHNDHSDSYPSGWHVRIPSAQLDLTIRPLLANQELTTFTRYWEGAVEVSGQRGDGKVDGQGYVELVGYAKSSPSEGSARKHPAGTNP